MSSQFANYFKNDEYEALFRFAYAPCDFVHPEYFNFNDFKNEMIINVCNDVIQDFNNHGDMYEDSYINLRFSRRPRISFQECFKRVGIYLLNQNIYSDRRIWRSFFFMSLKIFQ